MRVVLTLPPLVIVVSNARLLSERAAWNGRLQLIKFDPRVNAHVLFKEEKIKK